MKRILRISVLTLCSLLWVVLTPAVKAADVPGQEPAMVNSAEPTTRSDWPDIMGSALARTALMSGVQAPSAWAVIGPGENGELTTVTGGVSVGSDSQFLIGSLSKSVTAAAILILEGDGLISLDAPVSTYIPEFRPQDGDPVTIRELLTQTSGFDGQSAREGYREPTLSIQDRAAKANSLLRSGSDFQYSNVNYEVLGAVVEQISGVSYAEFVEARLFDPLGMGNSSADPAAAAEVANGGHTYLFGVPVPTRESVPVGAIPAGYVVSSAEDMAVYLRMLLRGGVNDDGVRILSTESVQSILSEQVVAGSGAAAPDTDGYGFGWGTGGTDESPMAAHVGRTKGYFAHALIHPVNGQGIVVLQAVNGPLYDQTGTVATALAVFDGENALVQGESAFVTALIFVGFGIVMLALVAVVGWLRGRRDRRSPAESPERARRRAHTRAVLDIGGAILLLVAWHVGAAMILTGTLGFPLNIGAEMILSLDLTLIVLLVAVILLVRAARTMRHAGRVHD